MLLCAPPSPRLSRARPSPSDLPGRDVPLTEGARVVANRETFETLARAGDVPGRLATRELKILVVGVDAGAPQLYFLNTNAFAFHYDFATEVLGIEQDLHAFNARTYFRDDRSNIAGAIIANDRLSAEAGLYALEFWPTDPVPAHHVKLAFDLVTRAMPFAAGELAYHPTGGVQEALYARDRDALAAAGVRTVLSADLHADAGHDALFAGPCDDLGRVAGAHDPTPRRPSALCGHAIA